MGAQNIENILDSGAFIFYLMNSNAQSEFGLIMAGVAQLVRAPDCDSGGRRFETGHSPHLQETMRMVLEVWGLGFIIYASPCLIIFYKHQLIIFTRTCSSAG